MKIDFYAPYPYPSTKRGYLYGAAAMNKRISDAGGMNNLAFHLVMVGLTTATQGNIAKKSKKL